MKESNSWVLWLECAIGFGGKPVVRLMWKSWSIYRIIPKKVSGRVLERKKSVTICLIVHGLGFIPPPFSGQV